MYVDKRLGDVQAVQTLSRLNRTHPLKEETFVLDFVNERQEILEAFKPYYEVAAIDETAQPSQLYELQHKLATEQVYYEHELEAFCKIFFKPKATHTPGDHAQLNSSLDPAVGRFKQLEPAKLEEYRALLVAFRNLYSFLAQIIPFQDTDLEKLYTFIRFLIAKLPKGTRERIELDDDVRLKYYRLQKISEGAIVLQPGERGTIGGPTAVGTGAAHEEKVELSRLIDIVNQRFGTEFTPADELFFNQIREEAAADSLLQQAAMANTLENFKFVFDKALEGLFIDRMEQNEEIFSRYMNDKNFQQLVANVLLRQVYSQIREQPQSASVTAANPR
jgi:type I restriction enzyme, R subunit